MTIKKSLLLAGALTTVGLASTVVGVSAATSQQSQLSLVDKISQKFNLDKDEVQEVFDEEHQEMQATHKAHMEERLTQAVKDGKLTDEQKAKILAKMEELKADRPDPADFEGKSETQIRREMKQKHAELKKWAADNDIPMKYLFFQVKFHHEGPGGPRGGGFFVKRLDS